MRDTISNLYTKIDSLGYKFDKSTGSIINKNSPIETKILGGNNVHSINGFGNTVGVNGDINVNKERKSLTDKELRVLYSKVLFYSKILGKRVEIVKTSYCNAPVVVNQIYEFLVKRGFEVNTELPFPGDGPIIKNTKVDTAANMVFVTVGHF